eukprot:g27341.t1
MVEIYRGCDRAVSSALRVQDSRIPGAGMGLFAAEELPEYVVIGQYSGEVKDYARFGEKVQRLGHNHLHPFYLKPGLLVDPTDEEGALHPASLRFASLATGVSFWNRTTTASTPKPTAMEPPNKRRRRNNAPAPEKAHWLAHLGVCLPDRELIVATDCGGSVGPPSALNDLGVRYRHIFACESDPTSQQLLSSQPEPPERLFGSMIGRDRGRGRGSGDRP